MKIMVLLEEVSGRVPEGCNQFHLFHLDIAFDHHIAAVVGCRYGSYLHTRIVILCTLKREGS